MNPRRETETFVAYKRKSDYLQHLPLIVYITEINVQKFRKTAAL